MNQPNDEWVWTRLDSTKPPSGEHIGNGPLSSEQRERLESERRFEEGLTNVLAKGGECPDAVWQAIRANMAKREEAPRSFLQRLTERRMVATLLAASVLVVLGAVSALSFLGVPESQAPPAPLAQIEALSLPALETPAPKAFGDHAPLASAFKQERANYVREKAKLEEELAAARASLGKLEQERDAVVAERDEAKTKLQEMEQDVQVARSQTKALMGDLARARSNHKALTTEVSELRQIAGLLGFDIEPGSTESGDSAAEDHAQVLSMTLPARAEESPSVMALEIPNVDSPAKSAESGK